MTRSDAHAFRAAGLVSLLTDFGLADPYVGTMHGVIAAHAPGVRVVDLGHGVAPQDVRQGGWCLAQAWRYFPAGSVHVAVVDPGVGSARRVLAARQDGHAFLAPDNGLLALVLDEGAEVRALDVARFALPRVSRTFHGRDVFSPAAAALASGTPFEELGPVVTNWQRLELVAARAEPEGWTTEVLYVDRFGNLITPLAAELLADAPRWSVEVAGRALPLVDTYADVAAGEALALVGSSGTLEVSVRDGDAARALGAAAGSTVRVRRSGA